MAELVVHDAERLKELQALPLDRKIMITQARIIEFVQKMGGVDHVCISFSGGKDSSVLAHIARQIYPDITLVFANTGLEYPEVQKHAREQGAVFVRPKMRFDEVISTYGYPLIGKEVAEAIYYARRIRNGSDAERERDSGLRFVDYDNTPQEERLQHPFSESVSDNAAVRTDGDMTADTHTHTHTHTRRYAEQRNNPKSRRRDELQGIQYTHNESRVHGDANTWSQTKNRTSATESRLQHETSRNLGGGGRSPENSFASEWTWKDEQKRGSTSQRNEHQTGLVKVGGVIRAGMLGVPLPDREQTDSGVYRYKWSGEQTNDPYGKIPVSRRGADTVPLPTMPLMGGWRMERLAKGVSLATAKVLIKKLPMAMS